MADIPLDVAHFLGLIVAICLYGIFFSMSVTSVSRLWGRRHRTKFVLGVTFSLFVITTVNLGIFIAVNYGAFIRYRESLGVEAYFDEWSLINPLQSAMLSRIFLAAAVFTSEVFILWRLYIIWPRPWWIVAVPAAFLATEAASPHKGSVNATLVCAFSTAMVNLLCTPLIAGRLWWIGGQGQPRGTREMCNTIVVRLVESGSLYTFSLIVYMIFTFVPGHFGVCTFLTYGFTMIVAIAPMLLILRLNIPLASEMHIIDFDATERADGRALPFRQAVCMVSTTIAFNPHPPTLSFQSEQVDSSTMRGRSSDKAVASYQEKYVDEELGPSVDVRSAGAAREQEVVDDVRGSKHTDIQRPFDFSLGLLYRVA
ncbi:hypothetical protein FRB95_005603 [Tulasnella sp. JGI-2019a]|nr:hypothetical protein FRB95_005603 [Tulasnella sp. JGI-2019a]